MKELYTKNFFDTKDFFASELFPDESYPWEALIHLITFFQKQPLGQIESDIPQGAFLVNQAKISIGRGVKIEPGAYIEGPCIIKDEAIIRHGAYIRPHVIIGRKCVVGHASEIKHSILFDEAQAAHFNYVGDSILGCRVNLGAGAKCANLRFDHKNISIHFKDQKIATGLKKLGAIIGDDAQIGCNAVLNPGTVMGKAAACLPCLNIGGFIPPHTRNN